MADPVELLAGTHVELVKAKITGGVRMRDGKVTIAGLEAEFADFHGTISDIEKLGSKGFTGTIIIEGQVIRESVPEGQGELGLPLGDDEKKPA